MPKCPQTLRVKITMQDGDVWFATAPPSYKSLQQRIDELNRIARYRQIGATYAYASELEYQDYQNPRPPRTVGVDIELPLVDVRRVLARY